MPRRKKALMSQRRQKPLIPQPENSLTFEIKEPVSTRQLHFNELMKIRLREKEEKKREEERREKQRLEEEAQEKREEEERERCLDEYLTRERDFRADQKRWQETMGNPYVGQTVALLLRPRCYRAILGTVVEMEEREWETESTSNETKGRGRFSLDRSDMSGWDVWMIQISRSEVEFCDCLYEYSHRFCGDYVYFLISSCGLGEEWGTDVYVRHLRDRMSSGEYAQLILETYNMGESRAIFFKKTCRRSRSREGCDDKRVGHVLNEKH